MQTSKLNKNRVMAGVLGVALFTAGVAFGRQVHMEAALDALQNAKNQLQQATNDKGGHRARAIELVDEAIDEVRKGMRFDRRH